MKRLRFFLLLSLIAIFNMMADTPLTATDFYQVYMDVPEVKEASENKGKLTENAKAFLWDENNPQEWVKKMNSLCPFDMGMLGQLTSVGYNEKTKTYTFNYLTKRILQIL